MTKKSRKKVETRTTVDAAEVRQFDALGAQWWDESGPMKPLHRLNPQRMAYIRDAACAHFGLDSQKVAALSGLTAADVGCGGGLVAEPLARMGANVTGIDAGEENIRIAAAHAGSRGLKIDYRATTVEDLAAKNRTYDLVTALEIVEHVADVDVFIAACCDIVKPGGMLVLSTLNRTPKSFLLGIVAAEYVLRWLKPGTHNWKKFLKPSEIAARLAENGFRVTDVTGLVYRPLTGDFALSKDDMDVNYFITAVRA